MNCKTCKFFAFVRTSPVAWQGAKGTDLGECHRYPPIVMISNYMIPHQRITAFPEVQDTWYCGEYKEGEL